MHPLSHPLYLKNNRTGFNHQKNSICLKNMHQLISTGFFHHTWSTEGEKIWQKILKKSIHPPKYSHPTNKAAKSETYLLKLIPLDVLEMRLFLITKQTGSLWTTYAVAFFLQWVKVDQKDVLFFLSHHLQQKNLQPDLLKYFFFDCSIQVIDY